MKKLVVPKFKNEAEEARWWDDRMPVVEENLVEALKTGTAGEGTAQRVLREARRSKNVTIRMPETEIERARRLAEKKGLGYQTYLKRLLQEALDREDSPARNRRARRTA
jgi:hypothetical protein